MNDKRISVRELKKHYPNPKKAFPSKGDDYCVGGALCLELGGAERFPDEIAIRNALMQVNPYLSAAYVNDMEHERVMSKISALTKYNDSGKFADAWKILGQLLRWKPKAAGRKA